MPNPSVVSDESGNNYGGISSMGSVQESQMAYLDNLFQLAQHAAPKPLPASQYFPGAGEGINVGNIGSKTLGSIPVFATGGGLFPFGALDEVERAKYEAEADYYKKLQENLDKPLFDEKLQLADPFKQPAFANKVQNTADMYLDTYAKRFGGDYGKAYVATRNDKNFQKTMRTYKEYADMFKVVFDAANDIETKRQKPDEFYVDPAVTKAVDSFLYSHDNLESLSPETLLKNVKEFKSTMAADKLAEAATAGYKDVIIDEFAKSRSMSTEETDVYLTTKKTNEGAAEDIINTALESPTYAWLKDKPEQLAIFKRGVENRIKKGRDIAVTQIKRANAARDLDLKSQGWMDESGNIIFQDKPSAVVGAIGKNSLDYPINKNQPIPTISGMQVYIRDPKGGINRVTLPGSYNMIPTSEYDLVDDNMPVEKGRYIEGKVNFQATEPYTPENIKPTDVKGEYQTVGQGKSSTQIKPVKAVDDAGNVVELTGETTVLMPYALMSGQIEANIPHARYAHEQLDKMTYPSGGRRNYAPMNNAIKPGATTIVPPDDATLDFFKDDPNVFYNWGGKVLSGAYIHQNAK